MVGWVSVGIALVAAFVGARWGLAGIIYGVGFGWIVRAVVAFALIMRHLRLPVSVPVTAP
jgi:Na+-driven multidrug efflux pump